MCVHAQACWSEDSWESVLPSTALIPEVKLRLSGWRAHSSPVSWPQYFYIWCVFLIWPGTWFFIIRSSILELLLLQNFTTCLSSPVLSLDSDACSLEVWIQSWSSWYSFCLLVQDPDSERLIIQGSGAVSVLRYTLIFNLCTGSPSPLWMHPKYSILDPVTCIF